MRIITGHLKGRQIPVPDTGELRPTADRTKEALFSVLDARRYLEGSRVLDLFAGSGNLGFEAISRGASSVLFVDRHPEHLRSIQSTARTFGIEDQILTRESGVEKLFDEHSSPFDLVFADPPYEFPWMEELIERILDDGWLAPEGWLVLEHDRRHDFDNHPDCFYSRAYGRTVVSMFERVEPDAQ
ncbi:MAG: 16S rRNA (guanine(966)-N(2))-methyltransferase RsmD [Bacteroidota bacterium]